MSFMMALKMAFKSLKLNKLRTFLTMLGVIIGVTAVALLTSVTAGAKDIVVGRLKQESQMVTLFFTNDEIAFSEETFKTEVVDSLNSLENVGEFEYACTISSTNFVAVKDVTGKYAVQIIKKAEKTEDYSPVYQYDITRQTSISVVSPKFFEVRNITIDGEVLDASSKDKIVVDQTFVKTWFGKDIKNEDVLGKTVLLGGNHDKIKVRKSYAGDVTQADYDAFIVALKEIKFGSSADNMVSLFNEKDFCDFENAVSKNLITDNVVTLFLPRSSLIEKSIYEMMLGSLGAVCDFELGAEELVSGSKEFEIVGIVTEESSFTGDENASTPEEFDSFFTPQIKEMLARTSKGSIYVLNHEENNFLVSSAGGKLENIDGAYFKFADEDEVAKGSNAIMSVLMEKLPLAKFLPYSDYMVVSMTSVAGIVDEAMNILTILLTVIACISLVVGGVGIMNIMLVTVSERTREIGIRKAIGAKKSSILLQFLVEAMIVTLFGGVIGLGISALACLIIGYFMGVTLIMPLWVILLSLGFCSLIGIAFGMYPAVKASNLHPIEALRRE